MFPAPGKGTAVVRGQQIDFPCGGRIERLVARWADTTPDAVALRFRDEALTYRELVDAATRVAAALAARGVGPGDRVAVRLDRDPVQAVAILGVFLTGAACAGVSVAWPPARYRQIVAATSARLAVVAEPGEAAGDVVEVTPAALLAEGQGLPAPALPEHLDGHAPALVFFSSGTTGVPHAIMTPHLGTVRVALDPAMGLGPDTRLLHVSPLGWDVPALELWGPLLHGGETILFDGQFPTSGDIREAVATGANTMFLTTGLLNSVVDDDIDCLTGLHHVVTGGERISAEHVDRMLARHPGIVLTNGYGPAECSIFASVADMEPRTGTGEYPIGRPVANTGVHLLDDDRAPVAVGERGEIALSGDGLALGYLGDEAATARKFVTLAPEHGGERVYLTGDVGILDGDGVLQFIGRKDHQFKLRGVRIDPFEIESMITALPGVDRAALIALPADAVTKTEAVAFVAGTADPAAVRAHLAERLPGPMVPGRILVLDGMPLLYNGKLDRRTLTALAAEKAPVTVVELPGEEGDAGELARAVAEAASALLGMPVGVDTDLLAIGAESLTAIRIANRVGSGLRPAEMLVHRTPRRIARHTGAAAAPASAVREGRSPFRVHGLPVTQFRMYHIESTRPDARDVVHPMLFRLTGPVDVPALAAAFDAVVARHEALRTRLRADGPKTVVADVLDPAAVTGVLDTSGRGTVAEFLARPFDLAADLPLRAALIGDELALAVHHTAFDGWSQDVLFRDLSAAARGELPPGEALGFQEGARRQEEHFGDGGDFWAGHLSGVPELPIPAGPVAERGPVAEVPVRIDLVDTAALRRACAAAGTTAGAFHLAAWIAALREVTGADDFAVGMPVAGRVIGDVTDVIGCFAGSAVLRFDASVPPGRPMVEHAAGLLRRALTDQFVPLERLLHELAPPATGRNPFCQAGFVLQNNPPAALHVPGGRAEQVRVPQRSSVFELALELWPRIPGHSVLWYRTDVVAADRAKALADGWLAHLTRLCS